MSRDVVLGDLFNVRDLGGYVGRLGRPVRWGMLLRGASVQHLGEEGRPDLGRLGLRTVVDLRRDGERAREPWPPVLGGLDVRAMPMLPDSWSLPPDAFPSPVEHLSRAYDDMRRLGRDTVRDVFALLAEPQAYPLLFFCIAGKDRTGLMAALVLGALGVDLESILDDYELSGARVEALVAHLTATGRLPDNPMIRQHPAVLRAPRRAMRASWARMVEEFGDVETYLRWCGVEDPVQDAVRELLLDAAPGSSAADTAALE